jgi:hypothetical protein
MRASRPPRVPFERLLGVTPAGGPHALELSASNLSLGGMFVQAGEAPPAGTRVALTLEAAGRWLDFAEAEVAWVGARGFGVRFTQLKPRARALIEHLVARGGTGQFTPYVRPRRARLALATAAVLALACAILVGVRSRATIQPPPPAAIVTPAPQPIAAPPADATPKLAQGEFRFALPTGGVSALLITIHDQEVVVVPTLRRGAVIRRVFDLPHPARLVIDVGGREPKYSWQLEGAAALKSVRIGARNHGTRVVVDFPDGPEGNVAQRISYRVVPPAGV